MQLAKPATEGPRFVILGGGNGTSRLLRSLLPLLKKGEITSLHALVHMSDDGGSTGKLREQYGVAAMGDLTRCLMALSNFQGDVRGDKFLKALDYRFSAGDLDGHTLRNALLAALEKTSDIDAAIATMARILQIPKYTGVIPTTLTTLTQQVTANGDEVLGEGQHVISHQVDMQKDESWKPGHVKVNFVEGDVELNPRAKEALDTATHIIVAPGHTYGTILPTLALSDLGKSVKESKAELMVVMTLLTTPKQTTGWRGEDFVEVYESYLGKKFDVVIGNNKDGDEKLVEGQEWVKFKEDDHDYTLIEEALVSREEIVKQEADVVPRAIVVHDAEKLRDIIGGLLKK